jgi:putative ABC transport system permease protein
MNVEQNPLLERVYCAILRLHPRAFRERFAAEMIEFVRAGQRVAAGQGRRGQRIFWMRTLFDVLRSLVRERIRTIAAIWQLFAGSGANVGDAVRFVRRSPGVSTTIILLMALTIGAASSVFSVVNAVLLKPLPFREPDRLMMLWEARPQRNIERNVVSGHEFPAWNEANRTFEGMAAIAYSGGVTLTGAGEPKSLTGVRVTSAFFDVMGVPLMLGRGFVPQEDVPGNGQVVVMNERLWRDRFNADRAVIGRRILLDGRPFEVVGVLAEAFSFPRMVLGAQVDYWAPIAEPIREYRGRHYLSVVGRLRPGVSIDAARADMARVARDLTTEFPQLNRGHEARVVPLQGDLVRDSRALLLLLMGAVSCLLLIGCSNIASLLLARGLTRRREIGVRLALGGGRLGIARQLLAESLLLATCGAALGVAATFWIANAIPSIVPRQVLAIDRIPVDLTVLGFALGTAIATGLLFGIAPALQIRGVPLAAALQQTARTINASGHPRLRQLFVAGQVALTLVLVLGAGLMGRGFVALATIDPGYTTQGVLAVNLALPGSRYSGAIKQRQFYQDLVERAAAVPGVISVAATNAVPLGGANSGTTVDIEGRPSPAPGQELSARYRIVSSDYFKTLRIPVIEGRVFTAADARVAVPVVRWFPQQPQPEGYDAPQAAPVAVINAAMAKQFWPNDDPVGRRFKFVLSPWFTVVGVVANTRNESLREASRPEFYLHDLQEPQSAMHILVRAAGDPGALGPSVREAIWSLDRDLAITSMRTMDDVVGNTFGLPRLTSSLVGTFAVVALGLMAAGIYGLVAFTTTQRLPELGVRIALGADRASVLRLMVFQGLTPASLGIIAGLASAAALVRVVEEGVFGVPPLDPATWISVTLLLVVSIVAACWWPAYRAARVDPVNVLRSQ